MPETKIVNEQEVLRWFGEGRTYHWMVEEYGRKYGIETAPSMWGNIRRRYGLDRRITRNADLIPWQVRPEHRWAYPVGMLRMEARRREGRSNPKGYIPRLDAWLERMAEDGTVVHYDPETDEGWFYVPRRQGLDTDIIRTPVQLWGGVAFGLVGIYLAYSMYLTPGDSKPAAIRPRS